MLIGIDPGLMGGFCLRFPNDDHEVYAMPVLNKNLDLRQLTKWLRMDTWITNTDVMVVIEKVHSMPKQGVASSFKFGDGYGQIKGLCAGLGYPFILVTPQQWKKTILNGYDWKGNKDSSIAYVKQRYPDINLKPTERSRKDSHGLADAVCLAEYGLREVRR